METSSTIIPVTALHACKILGRKLLLSGRGSHLYVYDCESRRILLRKRIFVSQVIHGISSRPGSARGKELAKCYVLLWAGDAVSVLLVTFAGHSTLIVEEHLTSNVSDWIFFGEFLESDHAANGRRVYVVTAHNDVLDLIKSDCSGDVQDTLGCRRLVSGPACTLYSAHARCTKDGLLVAAGTVFGEVVLWLAKKEAQSPTWSMSILNVLHGHKGSIFGIHISEDFMLRGNYTRLVATCSDDRTIRIWNADRSSQSVGPFDSTSSVPVQLSDVTGFGEGENTASSLLAVTWGHLSRIWSVKFIPRSHADSGVASDDNVKIISIGEDASFQFWNFPLETVADQSRSEPIHLPQISSHTNHSGKSIWSSDIHSWQGKYTLYTGGADGAIVANTIETSVENSVGPAQFQLREAFSELHFKVACNKQKDCKDDISLKNYACLGNESVIAITDKGRILHAELGHVHPQLQWTCLKVPEAKSPITICKDTRTGSVFLAQAGGYLCAIQMDTRQLISSSIKVDPGFTFMRVASRESNENGGTLESSILIPTLDTSSATLLCISIHNGMRMNRRLSLRLPKGFVPSSACHHVQDGILLLGSRSGAIAAFEILADTELAELITVVANVHSSDTVTSLMFLTAENTTSNQQTEAYIFVLSTGRDGTYAVYQIKTRPASAGSPSLSTIHRSSPPIGPNIEGAYLTKSADGKTLELLLLGFKSKDFVVWNETQQTEVLSVDCGGAHRSWTYSPIQNKIPAKYLPGGTFVWTKAGSCNIYRKSAPDHHFIQRGGQGREIKALAIRPGWSCIDDSSSKDTVLVATGAEDTTIKLFVVDEDVSLMEAVSGTQSPRCISVLNGHTTGIQQLHFSPCGSYLFSSGGCEELFVWRLHFDIPVIAIGVVLECMLLKTPVDADTRITDFAILEDESSFSRDIEMDRKCFHVAAAYSNGKIKILRYVCEHESRKGGFELLQEIVEGSFCLTRIHCVSLYGKNEATLTAGTNGSINVHFPEDEASVFRHHIHQNSIQTSLCISLVQTSALLMVTGGDDNALSLTLIPPAAGGSAASSTLPRSMIIPNAHAAAVTGLALMLHYIHEGGHAEVVLASVSNDQKVKIWRVRINTVALAASPHSDEEMQDVQIEKIAECWTAVADAAAIELLTSSISTGDAAYRLLVVGVGMEILHVSHSTLHGQPRAEPKGSW